MSWKLFLDDERQPIGDDWIIARSVDEAMGLIVNKGYPKHISFDHDLGTPISGYTLAEWLVEQDLDSNWWEFVDSFTWFVHSQNPIGAANINNYLERYSQFKFKGE